MWSNSEFLIDLNNHNQNGRFTHILTVVDFFSKKVWARAMASGEAFVVQYAFQTIIQEAQSIPRILQTDNGVEFTSDVFRRYLQQLGIKHILTKPYASQSNGLIERVNEMIRKKIRDGFVGFTAIHFFSMVLIFDGICTRC